jgi:hypothetical protein
MQQLEVLFRTLDVTGSTPGLEPSNTYRDISWLFLVPADKYEIAH